LLPPVEIGLKWPNDVYLQWRKVSGILVEASPRRYGKLVVGIGINVNNSFNALPADVRALATSLSDVAHCYYDLNDVLIRVLNQLSERLNLLETGDPLLAQQWQSLCLLRGRKVCIEAGSRRAVGRCQGIDAEGALRVQSDSGSERFFAGTVSKID
jgi:BirA family biotin operon repressor/biotin-[acetyl-CoA-carboxylase] ligase